MFGLFTNKKKFKYELRFERRKGYGVSVQKFYTLTALISQVKGMHDYYFIKVKEL